MMDETKYRFSYRIRIENRSPNKHVQLLGRFWSIQELVERDEEDVKEGMAKKAPMVVQAPITGAGTYY
jgi:uncharacterized protein affecting Mg2+/Co2+ transport